MDNELTLLDWLKRALEYIGGAQDDPPPGFPIRLDHWWFWVIWWSLLALAVYAFCGQSSKFIYIDF